jgi:hypothetical protein
MTMQEEEAIRRAWDVMQTSTALVTNVKSVHYVSPAREVTEWLAKDGSCPDSMRTLLERWKEKPDYWLVVFKLKESPGETSFVDDVMVTVDDETGEARIRLSM